MKIIRFTEKAGGRMIAGDDFTCSISGDYKSGIFVDVPDLSRGGTYRIEIATEELLEITADLLAALNATLKWR